MLARLTSASSQPFLAPLDREALYPLPPANLALLRLSAAQAGRCSLCVCGSSTRQTRCNGVCMVSFVSVLPIYK